MYEKMKLSAKKFNNAKVCKRKYFSKIIGSLSNDDDNGNGNENENGKKKSF